MAVEPPSVSEIGSFDILFIVMIAVEGDVVRVGGRGGRVREEQCLGTEFERRGVGVGVGKCEVLWRGGSVFDHIKWGLWGEGKAAMG